MSVILYVLNICFHNSFHLTIQCWYFGHYNKLETTKCNDQLPISPHCSQQEGCWNFILYKFLPIVLKYVCLLPTTERQLTIKYRILPVKLVCLVFVRLFTCSIHLDVVLQSGDQSFCMMQHCRCSFNGIPLAELTSINSF